MVEPSDSVVVIELIRHPTGPALQLHADDTIDTIELDVAALNRRGALVADALEFDRKHQIGSYYASGEAYRDEVVAASARRWALVRDWDYLHIAGALPQLFPRAPQVVLFPGRFPGEPRLAEFSVRRALRQAAAVGHIDIETTLRFNSIPTWGGAGEDALSRSAHAGRLPQVFAERTQIILLPRPAIIEDAAVDMIDRWGVADFLAASDEFRGGFLELRRAELTRHALLAAARAAGAQIIDLPAADEFVALLAAHHPDDDHTQVVIGHQDDEGIHCHDRPVSLAEIEQQLTRTRPAGIRCASVDLAVCRAGHPNNLAPLLQSAGAQIVLHRGEFAYYGRTLLTWLIALRLLEAAGPCSLSTLHDRVWAALTPDAG